MVKVDSLLVLELDQWEVVTVDENRLRLFLVQRQLNIAAGFNDELDPQAIEYCLLTEDLQSAFDILVDDYNGDRRLAYRQYQSWLGRIKANMPD